jgi:hypothetical protein
MHFGFKTFMQRPYHLANSLQEIEPPFPNVGILAYKGATIPTILL